MLATVLLLGCDSSSQQLPHESYHRSTEWMTEGMPDGKGALLFQGALPVPSPTPESSKLEEEEASVHQVNTTPKLRRAVSFTLPRTDYWELDVLLGEDDDEPFLLAESSTIGFVTQHASAKRDGNEENLEKAPSLTAEQVNELADSFIARFYKQMRLERQESDERAWEMLNKLK